MKTIEGTAGNSNNFLRFSNRGLKISMAGISQTNVQSRSIKRLLLKLKGMIFFCHLNIKNQLWGLKPVYNLVPSSWLFAYNSQRVSCLRGTKNFFEHASEISSYKTHHEITSVCVFLPERINSKSESFQISPFVSVNRVNLA